RASRCPTTSRHVPTLQDAGRQCCPTAEEHEAADRRDRAQPASAGHGEQVETSGEQDGTGDEQPPGGPHRNAGPVIRSPRDCEERQRVVHLVARAGLEHGEELRAQPFAQGVRPRRGDKQPYKDAPHDPQNNRARPPRPATNRAVIPGFAWTPNLESSRMAPLRESRPAQASDTPANGPRSAGQPLTMACSGWPNQLTASVSARGWRKTICPRNTQSRPTTTVAESSVMSWSRKRSLMPGAAGKVRLSPRATDQWPA